MMCTYDEKGFKPCELQAMDCTNCEYDGVEMSGLMYKEDFLDLFYVMAMGQDKRFITAVEQVVSDTPTVDAVEVVRCKDCQFWDSEHISSEGLAKCVTGESGIRYRRADGFCSYGERKDG